LESMTSLIVQNNYARSLYEKPAGIFYDSIKGVMRSQFHLTRHCTVYITVVSAVFVIFDYFPQHLLCNHATLHIV
jgi:hypothetical protein